MIARLRPLFPYMKKYRGTLLFGAVCVLLNNGVWILFAQVLSRAINDLNLGVSRHKLVTYSFLLLAVAGTKGIFQFLTRWLMIGVSREIEFDLRNDLFRHLEGLSYSYYQRTRTGDVMAKATNDLNAVRMLIGPAIMYSANTFAFMSGALFFMLHISPKLTLYAFAPLPIASIVIQYFSKQIHERFERIQAMFSDITARVQENLSGVRVIRAFVQEDPEIARFEAANDEYIHRSLRLVRLMGMLWPTLELMLGLSIILVLWLGGREVLTHRINLGDFVAFNIYMVQLTWPIIALGWVINIFQRGTASMARIQQIFDEKSEITDADVPFHPPTEVTGTIEFRDLTFAYPPRAEDADKHTDPPLVLKNVNLTVPAGTSLAIVGPTGSGKSTLVNLIPRIYDAAPNSVLIDGRPIREFPLELLRKNVGFVPQETFLFSDTIRENIAFGAPDAPDTEIRAAAEAASIAAEIEEFPESFNTVVGERGITLSGGQKQRTAIARALIRNPKILVLDDALASVDTQTEDRILNHLRRLMQGRTTVFISHRVSTVRNADQIAVLENGQIVELGTHDELVAKNGYYTELYNKQLLEEELETV
ncbi:ABC transporter, ATPase subunit [Candidatus Koribacter versatilis Ellin345]|uniref:Multidrug resistance-like ATP-binding protein MdlA n=1 Tax=Koribacter versatilis (strain Ellin345) TaxID=204669 RepID=Q1IRI4_KORVE|nr:ABC transporter ATP-binding protein [Candidatus Koribacter versatilis]ABF40516.1 ABC transporter, ATPase subunit [Candidatus Koribacter versatilis Ellin345]